MPSQTHEANLCQGQASNMPVFLSPGQTQFNVNRMRQIV